MKFNSIREFFNTLYNILYGILLVPLLVFVYLYLEQRSGNLMAEIVESSLLVWILSSVVIFEWAMSFVIFHKGMKAVEQRIGLGERLEKYRSITIVRYAMISSSCLILALGFYLTQHQVFTALFVMAMILQSSFWPTTYRLANHLKLKGEEREMIIRKKDF